MRSALPAFVAAALCAGAPAFAAATCAYDPAAPAKRRQWCGCPSSSHQTGKASAVDLAHRVTPDLLAAARANGVTTVFRYYDWARRPGQFVKLGRKQPWPLKESGCDGEPVCEKVVTKKEIAAIHAAGLNVAIVFQHNMHDLDTWRDAKRPAYDAARILQLAHALGQPKGTTIWIGVDGADQNFIDHGDASAGMKLIKRYFRIVAPRVRQAGYAVGGYGSGLVCDELVHKEKLASMCWLSLSTGHPQSKAYEASRRWTIKQCATRSRFLGTSSEVDPDIVNAPHGEFGQWRPN